MLKIMKLGCVVVLASLLFVSCSIFKPKSINIYQTTVDNIHVIEKEQIEESVSKKEVVSEPKKSVSKKEVEKPETNKVTRVEIPPFTSEQSESVVIPEFKNHVNFKDFNIDLAKDSSSYPLLRLGHVTSKYGWRHGRMHEGVDLKGDNGDSICAVFDGVVRVARWYGYYGNCVVIRHYNGLETVYGHSSKLLVKENQKVKAGEVIALVGRTGRATGYHLHLELRVLGQHVDPSFVIDTDSCKVHNKSLYVTLRGGKIYCSHSDDKVARDNEIKEQTKVKYYIVKSGDTLSRIAINNRTTVTKLCIMNNITSRSILRIGQRIRVQ